MQAQETNFKPYRIIGAYDSETTNIIDSGKKVAFPILHQLGLIDKPIETITSENVEDLTRIYLYRHTLDLYEALERIVQACVPYVPVICCHNLAFDMYGLAAWLGEHDVKVLAKSQRKPITFTILDSAGEPRLVIWDTLVFSQKSLDYMGKECHYKKLSGEWDYDLIRTPKTPLTKNELEYAKHDIYALLAWLGYWCRLNPDIRPEDLGLRVVSKTGIVRRKRINRYGKIKGLQLNKTISQFWSFLNNQNKFQSDDELYTCIAATRGGFTFCARKNANKVFDFSNDKNLSVYGFDATSQHPSQIVSHRYPVKFEQATKDELTKAFNIIKMHTIDDVLEHYEKPFGVAFYGTFKFKNLRLKKGSLFERYGIAPLAAARCQKEYTINTFTFEENQQSEEFKLHMADCGFRDKVINPKFAFGKLENADTATLYLTELAAWEVCQAYDFDSVEGVHGYITLTFDKPSDMSVVSVMQFYEGKNAFKHAQEWYFNNEKVDNVEELLDLHIPEFVVKGMQTHTVDDGIVNSTYLGLKADLNALFGIEASNEYRRDTVLKDSGIEYTGAFGICNAPKQPKAFYQCGQRIVGWSRIAQIIVMLLCEPYIETIINGDTDSVKFAVRHVNVSKMQKALKKMNVAIDKAKDDVCLRIKENYPKLYSNLKGIGYYVLEFETKQFCAAWNKAYCIRELDKRDNEYHCNFTLAGVPTSRNFKDKLNINQLADKLIKDGWSFGEVCDRFLGYNTTYANDITALNARSFPEWGSIVTLDVTDYMGKTCKVTEPSALCLYAMAKTINDEGIKDNEINMHYAKKNRPSVNTKPCIITSKEIIYIEELINGA